MVGTPWDSTVVHWPMKPQHLEQRMWQHRLGSYSTSMQQPMHQRQPPLHSQERWMSWPVLVELVDHTHVEVLLTMRRVWCVWWLDVDEVAMVALDSVSMVVDNRCSMPMSVQVSTETLLEATSNTLVEPRWYVSVSTWSITQSNKRMQ
jgi:hypothetical protein